MAHVISFRTSRFDANKERPNPFNPIAGESVLVWIRDNVLTEEGESTEPDAEDWGWYMDVTLADSAYLVGASGQFELKDASAVSPLEWLVQVEKARSFLDKLLGRNKMQADDPLVSKLVDALRSDAAFSDIAVEADA